MIDDAEIIEEIKKKIDKLVEEEQAEIVSDNEVEIARINADAAVEIAKIELEDKDEQDDITWLSNRLDGFAVAQENIQLSQEKILNLVLEMTHLLKAELVALKLLLTPIYPSPASLTTPTLEESRPEKEGESRALKTGRIRRFL